MNKLSQAAPYKKLAAWGMTAALLISAPGLPCYNAMAATKVMGAAKTVGGGSVVATNISQIGVPQPPSLARTLALAPASVTVAPGVTLNSSAELQQVAAQVEVSGNNDTGSVGTWTSLAKFWERARLRPAENSPAVAAPAIVSQKTSGLNPTSRGHAKTIATPLTVASLLALPAAAMAAEPGKILTTSAWHFSTTGAILLALGAVIAIVLAVKNWRSTSEYPAVTGARWKMNKSFARKLVDDGKFFMIPLNSGMQTPIIDAVKHLADTKDTDSIPRLRTLFDKFTYDADTSSFDKGWGPMDYMPPLIQAVAIEALLKLLPPLEAKEFAMTALTKIGARQLGRDTVENLLSFLKAHRMKEATTSLLDQAEKERAVFDRQLNAYLEGSSGGLTYAVLYKYEDMAYAAYQLAADAHLKEKALQMLIAEYNHVGATINHDYPTARPHDHINIIVSQIVDHDLADDPAELSRIMAQLDQQRLKKDLEYYRRLKEIHKKPVLIDFAPA